MSKTNLKSSSTDRKKAVAAKALRDRAVHKEIEKNLARELASLRNLKRSEQ